MMKTFLKYILLTTATVLAFGILTPSHAQQREIQQPSAAQSQFEYQPTNPDRYSTEPQAQSDDVLAPGLRAYGYVPLESGEGGCVMQGTFGKPADYANCY